MKVHIIGQAGSGKTTLARWIANRTGAEAHDLDRVVYGRSGERPLRDIVASVQAIAGGTAWITEGAYRDVWLLPLLQSADRIIWLDLPLRVCLWRIFRRHLVAEARRNNQHPGWRNLALFMRYTWQVDARLRSETAAMLDPPCAKVLRCRNARQVEQLRAQFTTGPGA